MFRYGFPLMLCIIQALLAAVTWRHLKRHYPDRLWLRRSAIGLFVLFNLLLVLAAIVRPRVFEFSTWALHSVVFPFFIWQFATLLIGLILLAAFLVKLPFRTGVALAGLVPVVRRRIDRWRGTHGYQRFDASRRLFLRRSTYTVAALSFGGTAYGAFAGRDECELTTAEFVVPGLPPALDGFTLGLVSDIHSSAFMTLEDMKRYVTLLNGMQTDMVVVVGDIVTGMTEEVYPFAEAFSAVRAPYGVYGVTGNHEYYTQDPDLVLREIERSGITLLSNDRIRIERNGASFYLLGIDDTGMPSVAASRLAAAARDLPIHAPRVLLCHRPYFFQSLAAGGAHLVLSGHTHGGQVRLGQIGETYLTPAALASPYIWGRYEHGGASMYVSRGIGTVGVPFRINCPPELTRIVLRSPERLVHPGGRA